jgi:hypothetical protein
MTVVRLRIFAILICTLSFPAMAGDFSMSGFPLNPLPDDARCIAMGVACTAIGDRGEASGVNPAAATGDSTTSLNVQLRHAILETVYLDQEGLNAEALGAEQGQLYMPLDDSPTEISRAGINVPLGRWSLGGFYRKPIGFSGPGTGRTVTTP